MKIYSKIRESQIPLIFLTPLRACVILITPYFVYWMKKHVIFKTTDETKILFVLFFISSVIGLAGGTDEWQNILVACLIEVPIIYLFSSNYISVSENTYHKFILYSTITLAIVDILGYFVFFFYHVRGDDSFGLPYGRHFTSVHGLSLLNAIYCLFYYRNNFFSKKFYNRLLSFFFLISFLMCFYGLGLVSFIMAIVLYLLLRSNPRKLLYGIGIFLISIFVLKNINSSNLAYLGKKLNDFSIGLTSNDAPRKILFVRTAIERAYKIPVIYNIFGLGPGAYNGRVASLLGEDSENPFTEYLGAAMPKYYRSDVFRYWNKYFVSMRKYNDGTINKPHSSLISVFMENGLIFGLFFMGIWIKQLYYFYRRRKDSFGEHLFIIHLFFLFNFITEQWLETSEFIYFVIYSSISIAHIRTKNGFLKAELI